MRGDYAPRKKYLEVRGAFLINKAQDHLEGTYTVVLKVDDSEIDGLEVEPADLEHRIFEEIPISQPIESSTVRVHPLPEIYRHSFDPVDNL